VRILAVDTSLGACSVALVNDEKVLAHAFEVMARGHAEALAPMVEAAMKAADCDFSSLERLAVTTGPGTFTGQRVGLAFMRAMRIALGSPLVGVTTLAVMAEQAMAETGLSTAAGLHDARRDEVYLEIAGSTQLPPCVLPFAAAVERLAKLAAPFALAGTAAERAHEHLPASVLSHVRQPDALWVANLARTATPAHEPPRPLYLRAPDAKLPAQR
jgi:tRNA threonylcarbamoyladenosine biosynthesis protein TsaB